MFRSASKAERKFKEGLSETETRRRRQETSMMLRRSSRMEQVQKRRMRNSAPRTQQTHPDVDTSSLVADINKLQEYVAGTRSQNKRDRFIATTLIRKLLSVENSPPLDTVVASGVVPTLVAFLTDFNDTKLQFEACWALTNIASGTSSQMQCLTQENVPAIRNITNLLRSDNLPLLEQAVWCLSNIAGDGSDSRDAILNAGGMDMLCAVVTNHHNRLTLVRHTIWAISNLCRGKPKPSFAAVQPAVKIACGLIMTQTDVEILTDACWALSYLADDDTPKNSQIQMIINTGVLPRLVRCLANSKEKLVIPALRTIGNIVTGDDHQTEACVKAEIVPELVHLISHKNKNVRKESCWALSNIAAGTKVQIQELLAHGAIPALNRCMQDDLFEVRKEAAWTMSNITNGGVADQIRYVAKCKGMQALISLFDTDDATVIMIALEGLENILEVGAKDALTSGENIYRTTLESCGGLDKLEDLQDFDSEKVYRRVSKLLREYCGAEEDEDDMDENTPFDAPVETSDFNFGGDKNMNNNNKNAFSFDNSNNSDNKPFSFNTDANNNTNTNTFSFGQQQSNNQQVFSFGN